MASKVDDAVPVENIKDKKVRARLAVLGAESRTLTETIAELEAEKKEKNREILQIMEELELTKVAGPGFLSIRAKGSTSRIVPERLLEKGVTQKIIDYATDRNEYEYVQVRNRKNSEDAE